MEMQMIGAGCAAISVHTSIEGPGTAAELVRAALRLSGLEPWKRMELELFVSGADTLILARPAPELRVEVADWALPFFC